MNQQSLFSENRSFHFKTEINVEKGIDTFSSTTHFKDTIQFFNSRLIK